MSLIEHLKKVKEGTLNQESANLDGFMLLMSGAIGWLIRDPSVKCVSLLLVLGGISLLAGAGSRNYKGPSATN